MNLFDFTSYKAYVNARISDLPKAGRGEFQRIAEALKMHSTSISQIFRGGKELSLEQGVRLAHYMGLSEIECDFFLNLVEWERAGSPELKALIRTRMQKIKESADALVNRIPKDRILSESDKDRYYSSWYYGAIRILCDIPEFNNAKAIAEHLDLPLKLVNEAIRFLIQTGLCDETDGQIKMGVKRVYLEATSPLISRHHTNWRQKAIERFDKMNSHHELAFTSPMSLSQEDALKVRESLMKTIEEIMRTNSKSPSEKLYILNIDWLEL